MNLPNRILSSLYFTRWNIEFYYMDESVLLGTKPLVDSTRHWIRDPSGVFSVCHLCECRIVQWRHDSRLFDCFLASRLLFRLKAWRAGLRPSATKNSKFKSLQKNLKTRTRTRKPCEDITPLDLREKKPKITVCDDSSHSQYFFIQYLRLILAHRILLDWV